LINKMNKNFIVVSFVLALTVVIATSVHAQKFPDMVRVEGGTFMMGNDEILEDDDSSALPVHEVKVASFRIAKTETTVAQWRAFCNATGRQMPNPPAWGWLENHPVVNVSWNDANAYCKWLSDSTGKTYHLPTEAQWEFAARGGVKGKGFIYAGGQGMYMIGWFDENSNSGTQPVAQKRPNELGLYDMSGNAWEWCQDWYGPYATHNASGVQTSKDEYFKVLRGGSWNYILQGSRAGFRNFFSPDSRLNDYGFRVAMEEQSAVTTPVQTPPAKEPAKKKGN
jgi:formylglycine-generating enzyme required for sulfatase activity